jgi:ribosome-associated protein
MLEPPEMSPPADLVIISAELAIPADELRFRFSRSSGPGGQHVNRSETRVELLFDVENSPSLNDEQRGRIRRRLAGQIDNRGVLRVVSSASRSQVENRALAIARFQALIAAALRQQKRRIPTKVSAPAREKRLAGKRAKSQVKKLRQKVPGSDVE